MAGGIPATPMTGVEAPLLKSYNLRLAGKQNPSLMKVSRDYSQIAAFGAVSFFIIPSNVLGLLSYIALYRQLLRISATPGRSDRVIEFEGEILHWGVDNMLARLTLHPPMDGPLCLGATLCGTVDFSASQEAAAADPSLPKCVQVCSSPSTSPSQKIASKGCDYLLK